MGFKVFKSKVYRFKLREGFFFIIKYNMFLVGLGWVYVNRL